jgi:site-specific DNA-adenine methylase
VGVLHTSLKSPFPYFGGKSLVTGLIWSRLGKCDTYIEPFLGSGAVLLANPWWENCVETVNDLDHFIANAFRAIKSAPEETAKWADNPVIEVDLHARHVWLVNEGKEIIKRCEYDPDFYDAKVAGWWLWGIACWIGRGFCSGKGPWTKDHLRAATELRTYDISEIQRHLPHLRTTGQGVMRQLPHLGNIGQGVMRQLPHLGNIGQGVMRKRPHLGDKGKGVTRHTMSSLFTGNSDPGHSIYPYNEGLVVYLKSLAYRLRRVRICCGDWERICKPAVTWAGEESTSPKICGVYLDPPYSLQANRSKNIYAKDDEYVAHRVREWCIENGKNPNMRIALSGYEGEGHEELEEHGWRVLKGKTRGGHSGYAQKSERGKKNRKRERIWFSPACLQG